MPPAALDLSPVLLAMEQGDQAAPVTFTREVCHLPASDWPYVGQALFEISTRIGQLENPAAYIRKVAGSLKEQAEASLLGKQEVRDSNRRVIGHVTIGSYVRPNGMVAEEMLQGKLGKNGSALPYLPTDTTRASTGATRSDVRLWVEPRDDDERAIQGLQMAGLSKAEMARRLEWTEQHVHRVVVRLWRRRKCGMGWPSDTDVVEGGEPLGAPRTRAVGPNTPG